MADRGELEAGLAFSGLYFPLVAWYIISQGSLEKELMEHLRMLRGMTYNLLCN